MHGVAEHATATDHAETLDELPLGSDLRGEVCARSGAKAPPCSRSHSATESPCKEQDQLPVGPTIAHWTASPTVSACSGIWHLPPVHRPLFLLQSMLQLEIAWTIFQGHPFGGGRFHHLRERSFPISSSLHRGNQHSQAHPRCKTGIGGQ